jgi:hypothetical protein
MLRLKESDPLASLESLADLSLGFEPDESDDDANAFPRKSSLPEGRKWRDTGCDLAPSCLACPFSECRYDVQPQRVRAMRSYPSAPVAPLLTFLLLRAKGQSITQTGRSMGISKRTAMRYSHKLRLLGQTTAIRAAPVRVIALFEALR